MSSFKQIYPNIEAFNNKVITPLKQIEKNPIYLNDPDFKYDFEFIYNQLVVYFNDKEHNFNSDELFENTFLLNFNNEMKSFYLAVTINEKIKLNEITTDWFNTISMNSNKQTSDTLGTSESRSSTTPVDAIVETILNELPLNSAERNNIKNSISANTISTSKIINDYDLYLKATTAKFNNSFARLINNLSKMFLRIDAKSEYKANLSPVEKARFKSGEYVSHVDYLGEQNKQNINILQENIQTLNDTKQDLLVAGENINIENNVISATNGEGKVYKSGEGITVNNDTNVINLGNENNLLSKIKFFGDDGVTYSTNVSNGLFASIDFLQLSANKVMNATSDDDIAIVINRKAKNIIIDGNNYLINDNKSIVTKKYMDQQIETKQDKLTAGSNITIQDNVISATGGGSGKTYNGSQNIIVDNNANTISLSDEITLNVLERPLIMNNQKIDIQYGSNTIPFNISHVNGSSVISIYPEDIEIESNMYNDKSIVNKKYVDDKVATNTNLFQQLNTLIEANTQKIEINNTAIFKANERIEELQNIVVELENYIKELKNHVGWDDHSSFINWGSKKLYINNVNAYKDVGYGKEVISSESWVTNNYYTKTDLTNYSTRLNLAFNTSIGSSSSFCFSFQKYSTDELDLWFKTSGKSVIGNYNKDKRITQRNNDNWYFGS